MSFPAAIKELIRVAEQYANGADLQRAARIREAIKTVKKPSQGVLPYK